IGPAAKEPAADAHDCLMVECSTKELAEYKVVGRRSPPRPQVPLRSRGISRHGQSSQSRPGQRDTVLATVKAWPVEAADVACMKRRPSLTASARGVSLGQGRSGRRNGPQGRTKKLTKPKRGEDTEYNTKALDNGPHTRVGKGA